MMNSSPEAPGPRHRHTPNPASRSVLITGASSGIGAACASRLVGSGFRVFAGVRRQEDGERLERLHPERLEPVVLDVTRPEQLSRALEQVAEALGDQPLGGLVCNAGVGMAGPIEHLDLVHLRELFEVNVFGALRVIQACLPALRRSAGRVVVVSSSQARVPTPVSAPYNSSKAALEFLMDGLRMELKLTSNVQVSIVQPGAIQTPIWQKSLDSLRATARTLPPSLHSYAPLLESAIQRATSAATRALPPATVAAVVERALTEARPGIRYVVGRDAQFETFARKVAPDRLWDWLVLAVIGRGYAGTSTRFTKR